MLVKCSKCNFENESYLAFCENCGFAFPIEKKIAAPSPDKSSIIHPTVIQGKTGEDEIQQHESNCPKCSYLLTNVHLDCPNCGFTVDTKPKKETAKVEQKLDEPKPLLEEQKLKDISSPKIEHKLNENKSPEVEIQTPNESAKLVSISLNETSRSDIEINSDRQIISRSDISETDYSISTGEHCILTKEGDKWFIENKGSNGAVFIQVTGKAELNNNAMILLGDKSFTNLNARKNDVGGVI